MRFFGVVGWTEMGLIEAKAEEKGETPPSGLAGDKSVKEIGLWVAFKAETRARRKVEWPWELKRVCFASLWTRNGPSMWA